MLEVFQGPPPVSLLRPLESNWNRRRHSGTHQPQKRNMAERRSFASTAFGHVLPRNLTLGRGLT